jgi:hypothetical protein
MIVETKEEVMEDVRPKFYRLVKKINYIDSILCCTRCSETEHAEELLETLEPLKCPITT